MNGRRYVIARNQGEGWEIITRSGDDKTAAANYSFLCRSYPCWWLLWDREEQKILRSEFELLSGETITELIALCGDA